MHLWLINCWVWGVWGTGKTYVHCQMWLILMLADLSMPPCAIEKIRCDYLSLSTEAINNSLGPKHVYNDRSFAIVTLWAFGHLDLSSIYVHHW